MASFVMKDQPTEQVVAADPHATVDPDANSKIGVACAICGASTPSHGFSTLDIASLLTNDRRSVNLLEGGFNGEGTRLLNLYRSGGDLVQPSGLISRRGITQDLYEKGTIPPR
jgi:hypothetical protein